MSSVFEEPSGSVLPGHAVAELDWDDEEESTSVFDRSASDLFGDLAARSRGDAQEPEDTSRRDVGKAAALLAMSGQAAKAIPSVAPQSYVPSQHAVPVMPATPPVSDPMPRIPAPAPVPRDISSGATAQAPVDARPPHPSWAPSTAAGAAVPATPRSGASGATILLSLIAVLAAAAGVFFYLRSSSAADMEINVSHNGDDVDTATIFVDGREECSFAPCKLKVEPGEHEIRVTAGQLAGRQKITIEGGGQVQVTIPLGVAPDVMPNVPDTAKSAEPKAPPKLILASGMEPDVKIRVFINDEDKGELPITLDKLEAGDVKVRFEGGDKYGKVEKLVTLAPGEDLELKDVKLPLLKVKVKFELLTRGAKVVLISEGEKKDEETLSFQANKKEMTLDTSKKWTLQAELKGYDTFSKTIDFDGAGEELDFAIELKKEEEAPPAVPGPVSTPGPQPPTGPDPVPTPANDFGFINANSRPPSKVLIDGRPMGGTPVMGHKVKPGSHSIVFKHPELGTRSTSVTVAAGQTKTASVVFQTAPDPEPATKKKKKKRATE